MGILKNKILGIDSRKKKRTTVCVLVEDTEKKQEYFDKTADISEEGVFVKTDQPKDRGKNITLRFALPGQMPMIVQGQVARVTKKWRLIPGRETSGMGIRFLQLAPEERKIIQEFIES